MCFRMRRTVVPSVMQAMIRMSAEQNGHWSGIDSYRQASSTAQRYRAGGRHTPSTADDGVSVFCPWAGVSLGACWIRAVTAARSGALGANTP